MLFVLLLLFRTVCCLLFDVCRLSVVSSNNLELFSPSNFSHFGFLGRSNKLIVRWDGQTPFQMRLLCGYFNKSIDLRPRKVFHVSCPIQICLIDTTNDTQHNDTSSYQTSNQL